MTLETRQQATLLETARLELTRAHRAALALDAAEIRQGVQIALDALREAARLAEAEPAASAWPGEMLRRLAGLLERALADLQGGALAELGALIEAARKELEA